MKPRDKKMVILRQLGQESEPIGLPELMDRLQGDFKERSVRRWLDQFVDEGLVEKSGQRRGTKYCVVQRSVRRKEVVNSCFGSDSLEAIRYVKKPVFERTPTAYEDSWLDAYQPNKTFYFKESTRKQLHEAGFRAAENDPAGTYARQIYNRLLIDLSYNSSRLEGNTYSQLDTERLILKGTGVEGKLDEEKVMILNHKEAIRYLVENADRLTVSEQTILTLHYLLSDGLVDAEYAGKVRDHWVRISGSSYIPFDSREKLQEKLKKIVEVAVQIQDPFEQSLFLLVHVSYLQAFIDVNKRIARLAANIPLVIGNLVPLSFNDIERQDYISAIVAVYELQDVGPIADLFAFSYMRTCAAYDATVKAIGFDEVRVRFRAERRAILRELIVQQISGDALNLYIETESHKKIPVEHQDSFVEDVKEDIEQMDQSRISGLGITAEQLQQWLSLL